MENFTATGGSVSFFPLRECFQRPLDSFNMVEQYQSKEIKLYDEQGAGMMHDASASIARMVCHSSDHPESYVVFFLSPLATNLHTRRVNR